MKNFIQPGNAIDVTATADIASGELVVVGQLAGVATTSALSGEKVAICIDGVYELPKGSATLAAGAKVYYDDTNNVVASTATGNTFIGYATQAAATGDSSAMVLLARPGS